MSIDIILQGLSGVLWIITYILIIKKSIKDKTYGMPFIAMCLNLTWEFVFVFIYKTDIFHQLVCLIWFILDLIIVFIFLKYGYKDFKKRYSLSRLSFLILVVFTLLASFIFMLLAPIDFSVLFDESIFLSAGFIAYFQNLLMSILFVLMFLERGNSKGQSMFIALFKYIGTFCVAITKFSGMSLSNPTELFVIFLIQVFDILYIYLLFRFYKIKK